MEFGNAIPYSIQINASGNKGFIVNVGCFTCVFTDKKDLLASLEEYLDDPKGMEKLYNEFDRNRSSHPVPSQGSFENATGPYRDSLTVSVNDLSEEEENSCQEMER